MANNIAKLSISPDVIKMLGRKLYSSHPLPIVVRELLQNSVDACERRGVEPDIHIKIEELGNEIFVTCRDNGEGMTKDVLLNKFLCLGESGKRDNTNSTGGFGIAKAAIMSNEYWSVYTHTFYTDVTRLGKHLLKKKYFDGTIVDVTINEEWYLSTIRKTLQMVYFSDVKIHLLYVKNNEIIIDDPEAGFPLHLKVIEDFKNSDFKISLTDEFKTIDKHGFTWRGQNAYRLNGLVQFMTDSYERDNNVIIDLFTDKLPTDKDYPLAMSRENVTSRVHGTIYSKIKKYDENPLTTASKIRGRDDVKEKINQGIEIDASKKVNIPVLGKLQTLTEKGEKLTVTEKRLLRLWAAILSLTTEDGDYYGIGVETNATTTASRTYHEGNDYYLLNVKTILEEYHQTRDEVIFRLHMLAVHEACHYSLSGHNERFTSAMDDLYVDSIGKIIRNLSHLRYMIRYDFD